MLDIKRKENMTEEEYLWMVGQKVDSGEIDSWRTVNDTVNSELGIDEEKWRDESSFRKRYQAAKKFKENCFDKMSSSENIKKMESLKDSIIKEKRKMFDQRREYNKLLTKDARFEHLVDTLHNSVLNINTTLPLISLDKKYKVNDEREGLICFSDWHYGMVTDNIWNKYDTSICLNRVKQTVDYVTEYIVRHQLDKVSIVLLGDAAHGSCHVTCRVKSEEDTCDQLMHVSEIIAESINIISQYVNKVDVYTCYGNHLRTLQKKEDSVSSDNLEKIIPWWLKCRFVDNDNINIIDPEFNEFTRINILGNNICCVHGNDKKFKDIGVIANNVFTKKFNVSIDYTISGDKHHLEEFENYGIESILVRSLCGTDDYANDRNLYAKAGQTFIIFNKNGRECTYHIPLK